jgi:hypothetical protein
MTGTVNNLCTSDQNDYQREDLGPEPYGDPLNNNNGERARSGSGKNISGSGMQKNIIDDWKFS